MATKGRPAEPITPKSRTKDSANKCNVLSDFYGALDKKSANSAFESDGAWARSESV